MAGIFQPMARGSGSCPSFCRPHVGKPRRVPSEGLCVPLPPAGPAAAIPASETPVPPRRLMEEGVCLHPVLLTFHPGRAFYSPGDVSEVTATGSSLVLGGRRGGGFRSSCHLSFILPSEMWLGGGICGRDPLRQRGRVWVARGEKYYQLIGLLMRRGGAQSWRVGSRRSVPPGRGRAPMPVGSGVLVGCRVLRSITSENTNKPPQNAVVPCHRTFICKKKNTHLHK